MVYILIDGQFYRIFKESDKMELLKIYAKNKNAKIYTKKIKGKKTLWKTI